MLWHLQAITTTTMTMTTGKKWRNFHEIDIEVWDRLKSSHWTVYELVYTHTHTQLIDYKPYHHNSRQCYRLFVITTKKKILPILLPVCSYGVYDCVLASNKYAWNFRFAVISICSSDLLVIRRVFDKQGRHINFDMLNWLFCMHLDQWIGWCCFRLNRLCVYIYLSHTLLLSLGGIVIKW